MRLKKVFINDLSFSSMVNFVGANCTPDFAKFKKKNTPEVC